MAGRIEEANGGTLFLDEIGDMPMDLQPYLLKVLEGGSVVSRLGESKARKVDVRIIAATNQPLEELIEAKQFRSDLFYRLNGARLHLPPLRERRSDIPTLVERIHAQMRKAEGSRPIDERFIQFLMKQNLCGNIRELKTHVERYVSGLGGDWDRERERAAPSRIAHETLSLAEIERNTILSAVERHEGNVRTAAEELSMPRSTLYRKLAQYRGERAH
jgi:DNA-binding NtrC family response regulator